MSMMQRVSDMKIKEAQVKKIKRTIKSTGEQHSMSVQVHNTSNSTEYAHQMDNNMGTRCRDQTSLSYIGIGKQYVHIHQEGS